MKFGLLRVTTSDGRTREYPLDLPTLVIGRADGNSIVIDDLSVARRHARLTIDSGRLLVEDLGSAEGTFIGPQRIPANTPSLVENNQTIRFGDVTAAYEAPAAVSTDTAVKAAADADDVVEGQPYEMPPTVRASLTFPVLPLEAGGVPGVGTLVVQNRGRVVDELSVEVLDLPADWVRLSQSRFVLLPNDQTEVTLIVQPPRRADAHAGEYDFAVVVTSSETGREVLTNGHVSVLPFEATTLELHPVRSNKQFTLHAINNGNAPATYLLSGTDDEEVLFYEFALPQVELAAGEEAQIPFRVTPRKRRYLGPTLSSPFTVIATPAAEAGTKATAVGQVALRPTLQPLVRPALLTAVLAAIAIGLFWYFYSTSGNGVATANAEAPYAGVHMCDKDKTRTAKPEPPSAAAPLFEQNDPQWGKDVYDTATDPTYGPDWCGTIMAQCGAAITSLATVMNLFQLTVMPDGSDLTPEALNKWATLQSTKSSKGWVGQGYVEGDVVWTLVNQLSADIAKAHPGARLIRFAGIGTGSDAEVRAELKAGRPVILQIPGHWITAVGFDGDKILINDPYYRDRKTLDFYAGKVESSVLFQTSSGTGDLGAITVTVPSNVRVRVTDSEGRITGTLNNGTPDQAQKDATKVIPNSTYQYKAAWRDPTCVASAPPVGAGVNQIILPGVKDVYKIEVADATNGPTTVAVHVYDKNGTLSLNSQDNPGPAALTVNYDPDNPVTNINVVPGSPTTTPATTGPQPSPVPGGGGSGGQSGTGTAGATGTKGAGSPGAGSPGASATGGSSNGSPGASASGSASASGTPLPPTPAPPNNVTVACNPSYATSPNVATVTCTATIDGTSTTTNWTLNGVPFPAAQGQTLLTTTFTANTNATVAVNACNVNACKAGSTAVAVVFPESSPTGTPVPSATPSVTPTPTPSTPPAGPSITCTLSSPVNPDITCTASFSGDYTAIGWLAPGDAAPIPSAGFKSWTFHTSSGGGTITIGNDTTGMVGSSKTSVQGALDARFGPGTVTAVTDNSDGTFVIAFNVGAQVCNGSACVSAAPVQVQYTVTP